MEPTCCVYCGKPMMTEQLDRPYPQVGATCSDLCSIFANARKDREAEG